MIYHEGIAKIQVVNEMQPDEYPLEIKISKELLLKANKAMRFRDGIDEDTKIEDVMKGIIFLIGVARLMIADQTI